MSVERRVQVSLISFHNANLWSLALFNESLQVDDLAKGRARGRPQNNFSNQKLHSSISSPRFTWILYSFHNVSLLLLLFPIIPWGTSQCPDEESALPRLRNTEADFRGSVHYTLPRLQKGYWLGQAASRVQGVRYGRLWAGHALQAHRDLSWHRPHYSESPFPRLSSHVWPWGHYQHPF